MATWRGNPGYADGVPGATGRILFETAAGEPRGFAPASYPLAVAGGANGALSGADKQKLDSIETNATADQSNAEIEAAYNAQVAAASQAEAEAGTVTFIRRFTPERIRQAIIALAKLVNDTAPQLGGNLDGQGFSIIDYTQPHVSGVSGALTQAAHGGRAVLVTGNVTVPVTNGFVCLVRNESGVSRTITPASGSLIHEGTTKASISLPSLRSVTVHGGGTNVWVDGAIA